MPNKKLKAAIKKLLSKDRKLIKMKDLRLLVKSNEELSDIKLTGKGRTKIAIVSDLESRIKKNKKTKKQQMKYDDDLKELKRYKCPIVSEKELNEAIQRLIKDPPKSTTYGEVEDWEEPAPGEYYGLFYNYKKEEEKRNFVDPRKIQKVPPKSGNIVMIVAFDEEEGFKGHGTGCLIDDKHILTCAHLFYEVRRKRFRRELMWIVYLHDGSRVGMVSDVCFPKSWPPRNSSMISETFPSNVALLSLNEAIKSKSPYPVFGLSLESYCEDSSESTNVTIDGYPVRKKEEHMNGWREWKQPPECAVNFMGHFGKVTESGLDCLSMQTSAYATHGISGAPAMLCDDKGDYLTNGKSPIIVGIAARVGPRKADKSTVCVPITPWTIAFISNAIGYDVKVQNEYVRKMMATYRKNKKQ